MLRYLLDTDTCIYTIKNRPESVRHVFNENDGAMSISSITLMELVYGAQKSASVSRNLKTIEGFVQRLETLDFDTNAAHHAGDIRAELARTGQPIGPYDTMIAGHARSRGLILVTNNSREFSRVSGLRTENWTQIT